VKLYRRNYYAFTELASYSTTITAGTMYDLKLVTTGTNPVHLEVWLGGTKRIDYDDAPADRLISGGHGMFADVDNVNYATYRADAL
jgi:hypothetical protein